MRASSKWESWDIYRTEGVSCLSVVCSNEENSQVGRENAIVKTRFFINNGFIGNARLKLAKNQANAKRHPETELLLYENFSHSSSTLSPKNNRTYSKKYSKEQVFLYSWDYTINNNKNADENEKYIT